MKSGLIDEQQWTLMSNNDEDVDDVEMLEIELWENEEDLYE